MTNQGPHSTPGGLLINFAKKRLSRSLSFYLGRKKLLRGRCERSSINEFLPYPSIGPEVSEYKQVCRTNATACRCHWSTHSLESFKIIRSWQKAGRLHPKTSRPFFSETAHRKTFLINSGDHLKSTWRKEDLIVTAERKLYLRIKMSVQNRKMTSMR